jgi:hypothetical protein
MCYFQLLPSDFRVLFRHFHFCAYSVPEIQLESIKDIKKVRCLHPLGVTLDGHAEVARQKSTIKGATEHAIFLRALFFGRVEKPLAPRVPRSLETSEIDSKGQSTTVA